MSVLERVRIEGRNLRYEWPGDMTMQQLCVAGPVVHQLISVVDDDNNQKLFELSLVREVDGRLHGIMKSIHKSCLEAAEAYGKPGDYLLGANIAGFLKVANSMLAFGIV